MKAFFQTPGFWFNLLSFMLALAGCFLGIVALWIAYVQLRKTLGAAEAARDAAELARAEVRRIVTVTDLQKLSAICREIITLLGSRPVGNIDRPLHELRMGLAQFHATQHGKVLGGTVGSIDLSDSVESVQRKFDAVRSGTPDLRTVNQCLALVKKIDEMLHQMTPEAASM